MMEAFLVVMMILPLIVLVSGVWVNEEQYWIYVIQCLFLLFWLTMAGLGAIIGYHFAVKYW